MQDLRFFFSRKPVQGLHFHDGFFKTDNIRLIYLAERFAFITDRKTFTGFERDLSIRQFNLQGFLINPFKKAGPQFFMNLDCRAQHGEGLFLIHQLSHSPSFGLEKLNFSVLLRVLRG